MGDNAAIDIRDVFDLAPQTILFGADHLRRQLPEGGRFLAWDKLNGRPTWGSFGDVEFAWHSRSGAPRIFSQLWKGVCVEGAGNAEAKRFHATQKSVQLMQWCMEQAKLEPGSLVVDPYMGSGTTAIAALRMGHRFIGCEIDPLWFEQAVERWQHVVGDAGRQERMGDYILGLTCRKKTLILTSDWLYPWLSGRWTRRSFCMSTQVCNPQRMAV